MRSVNPFESIESMDDTKMKLKWSPSDDLNIYHNPFGLVKRKIKEF